MKISIPQTTLVLFSMSIKTDGKSVLAFFKCAFQFGDKVDWNYDVEVWIREKRMPKSSCIQEKYLKDDPGWIGRRINQGAAAMHDSTQVLRILL